MANGFVFYLGPSRLDGSPIVGIATGLARRSKNAKTGGMVQTYILRADMPPIAAVAAGADRAICGNCPLRGAAGRGRDCYVNLQHGPTSVWRAWQAGSYPRSRQSLAGETVRLGAYGDPAAIPPAVWSRLLAGAAGWSGYTHCWRRSLAAPLRRWCMASVETVADMRAAQAAGWRTFRLSPFGGIEPGEIVCPASAEGGRRRTCETCRACSGGSPSRRSVTIAAHAAPSRLPGIQLRLIDRQAG